MSKQKSLLNQNASGYPNTSGSTVNPPSTRTWQNAPMSGAPLRWRAAGKRPPNREETTDVDR